MEGKGLERQADRHLHRLAFFTAARWDFQMAGPEKKLFTTQHVEDKEVFIFKVGLFIITSSKQHRRVFTRPAQIYHADNLLL